MVQRYSRKSYWKVIANKLETLIEQDEQNDVPECLPKTKPYLNIKLVNDTLTVVLQDGSIISKPEATEEHFVSARNASSEEELLSIVISQRIYDERKEDEAKIRKIKALQNGIELLKDIPDFIVKGNTVYLAGTSRSLPQLLVEKFVEVVDRVSHEPSTEVFYVQLNQDEEYLSLKDSLCGVV